MKKFFGLALLVLGLLISLIGLRTDIAVYNFLSDLSVESHCEVDV